MFKKVMLVLLVLFVLLSLPTLASGSGDESEDDKCPDLVCLLAKGIDVAGNRNGDSDDADFLEILSALSAK